MNGGGDGVKENDKPWLTSAFLSLPRLKMGLGLTGAIAFKGRRCHGVYSVWEHCLDLIIPQKLQTLQD